MKIQTATIACMLVLAWTVPGPIAEQPTETKDRVILIAGVEGVTNPQLIEESKVEPTYPKKARIERKDGQVILQAVVETDGTVSALSVIRCNRRGLGFEESAIKAVEQWRYKPATKDGKPVPVYFTVVIEFSLR